MTADHPDADPRGSGPEPGASSPSGGHAPPTMVAVPPVRRPLTWRRLLRGLRTAAGTAVAVALLGAPLGLLWLAVAPAVPVIKTEQGAVPAEQQPEQFIAADGWFALLGLGFGVLAAVGAWLVLRRHRGPLGLAAVVVGALGAAVLAWWLGREIGVAEYHRLRDAVAIGEAFQMPPRLRAGGIADRWLPSGVLLLPAFGAAVTYTLLAGWSAHPGLRPEPVPPSSGSAPPRTPPAPPAPPAAGEAGSVRD